MLTPFTTAARLDRLPITRAHKFALATLAFVFLFEFGDLNTFAYVAPALVKHLGFSVSDIAVVTSAAFLGMAVGAAFGGRVSDLVGRKRALLCSTSLFSVFSLVNAAGSTVPAFVVFRFLTGVGLSAMVVAATTYISEVMPAARRGRMQSAVMAVGLAGIPFMSFSARGIVPLGSGAWRLVFVLGSAALLALPALAALPESPRWLVHQDRLPAAEAVLAKLERQAGPLPPIADVPAGPTAPARPTGYRQLFTSPHGRTTLFLAVVWIFQTLGFYGFVAWVPTLLTQHGFSVAKSLGFSALTTIGAIPGALLAWPVTDRLGRKLPLVVVALATAASGLAYGLTFNPVAIVVFGFCVNLLIQTFATLLYAYSPELFPTALRNAGHGLVYGTGRLANIFGPMLVASIFAGLGYQAVFVYIAACWLIVALAIALFGPRTGKRPLETLSARTGTAARAETAAEGPVHTNVEGIVR
ncbi:MFS transporter [Amycolatopsis orientalis]|uniref:MFS transporter n=1 Tax=Amycolatopsis orientalis TaxID=31958 RepID=UPI00039B4B09|nr:MFS transporter [Amycolatopsis orientalis]